MTILNESEFLQHISSKIGHGKIVSIATSEGQITLVYARHVTRPLAAALTGYCAGTGWQVQEHNWTPERGNYNVFLQTEAK